MANPTTNYGFVLPTSTDLVTDLPADFDVALQGVDTRLKALQPGTTLGDLVYASATANTNTRLPIGSNGQVLSIASGVPAWAAAPTASKYGQIVSTFKSDTFTAAAASTWTDITGMSVTITPTLASSKVLIQMVLTGDGNLNDSSMAAKLLRGSTTIAVGDAASNRIQASVGAYTGNSNSVNSMVMTFLDSPATTSATTYKVQGQALGGTNIYVNRTKTDPDSTSYARYASSITVTEILA